MFGGAAYCSHDIRLILYYGTNPHKSRWYLMKIAGLWTGIIAIIVGILVLALPHLLQWIVGVGLIVVGVVALLRR
jgi:uncharacterized membrane protein HdeD (DUF308 family)